MEANQIADNFCSLGLYTNENDYFNDQETPNKVTCPPHSLEFYYEHGGKTFDGDTSAGVAKLCDLEMRNRSDNRPKHGAAIRYLEKYSFNPTSIVRHSVKRRMLFGIEILTPERYGKANHTWFYTMSDTTGDNVIDDGPQFTRIMITFVYCYMYATTALHYH